MGRPRPHILTSVALGAALLIVLPLYEWLHTSGPRSDVFVSRRLHAAAFAVEGGAAMGLLSWWMERHSLSSSD